jgi:hypothetical protein
MSNNGQNQGKKKSNDKEILDFFYAFEDKLKEDDSKMQEFIEIINQESSIG